MSPHVPSEDPTALMDHILYYYAGSTAGCAVLAMLHHPTSTPRSELDKKLNSLLHTKKTVFVRTGFDMYLVYHGYRDPISYGRIYL